MTKILAFDSMHIVNPIRKIYISLIRRMLNEKETLNTKLILYRLDQENYFIRDNRNLSGMQIGAHHENIDAKSIMFYRFLEKSGSFHALRIKDLELYKVYTRQVKLKLIGVLRCAYRIRGLSIDSKDNIEIITDRQTISIMKEAFLFLNYKHTNISWKEDSFLTACITINSLVMRFAALIKMYISTSSLPKQYYYKETDSEAPTALIVMPKRRPEDFFSTYVEKLDSKFNIVLYSHGFLKNTPKNYKSIKIKESKGIIRGVFNIRNLFFSSDSYISDILLIFKYHFNLNISIDMVNSVFSNNIDVLVNRQQTNVLDNYMAIRAQKAGIFIFGDVFEEIFYCDSAVCSSRSQNTESLKLALAKNANIAYKGSNSLIEYRLKSFIGKQDKYLHYLLGIDTQKRVIFYASDPSKDESQRYLTEKFLINCFSKKNGFVFVMKTHPQDNGRVTHYAYLDSRKPSNVILIGDITQQNKIASEEFRLFDEFDFNSAVASCDGFLTFSSTSILQALTLGVKTGVVDKFNNGYYDYLINHKASMLINNEESLQYFLESQKLDISNEILIYCGLKNDAEEFDLAKHLMKSQEIFYNNKDLKGNSPNLNE